MVADFLKYFTKYIFMAKTRQGLLFLAFLGLFLSSFSLVVMQSVMGGLQHGVVKRSKDIQGDITISFHYISEEKIKEALDLARFVTLEYEQELLLKSGPYLAPAALHGIDERSKRPPILADMDFTQGVILGYDLRQKLNAHEDDKIEIISPAHTNDFFGDIPRMLSEKLQDSFMSNVQEVDLFHAWTRASLMHNLIREKTYNRLRFYNLNESEALAVKNFSQKDPSFQMKLWEESNASLVWALSLEHFVMIALFMGMSLLVAITISTGFMLFFDKIKPDLLSFWLLGLSLTKIKKYSLIFLFLLSAMVSLLGTLMGLIFLKILERSDWGILPDIFVETKLPVFIEAQSILLSFIVPYSICLIMLFLSFRTLNNNKESFLTKLRRMGH